MNLAELSIKRPVFISCIIILIIIVGAMSFYKLPVEEMPDMTVPVITLTVAYNGAGPEEVETSVTKPLEEQVSAISGIKRVMSKSLDSISQVIIEFNSNVDIKYAEQQVRNKVAIAKTNFPNSTDISEVLIENIDTSSEPVVMLALSADIARQNMYDWAEKTIKNQLMQVNNVGQVTISGISKREIQVQLDRNKLRLRNLSVGQVANQIQSIGENVPNGRVSKDGKELDYRTIGSFGSVHDIESTVVNLEGNEVPTKISDIGEVKDTFEDETSKSYINGKPSVFITVYKRAGVNTLEVTNAIINKVADLNREFKDYGEHASLTVIRDSSTEIKDSLASTEEAIIIGIILTVIVVFMFLGNWRSTIITGLALPNSLLGAFIFMYWFGFTTNIVSLLALTVAVGLLIDDAIVVRENIFRHMENGSSPLEAALAGTKEVRLAVIATTAVVLAAFAPLGFMSGMMKAMQQFGVTVCFAMLISLFDALTIAPMLSRYFAGAVKRTENNKNIINRFIKLIDRFQEFSIKKYTRLLKWVIANPGKTIITVCVVFIISMFLITSIPSTFMQDDDTGELVITFEKQPGVSLKSMEKFSINADKIIRAHNEVAFTTLTVGGELGESYKSSLYLKLAPLKERKISTQAFKALLNNELHSNKSTGSANPHVKTYSVGGPGPDIQLNLTGSDQEQLEQYALKLYNAMSLKPQLRDVDTSYRTAKPEFQVKLKKLVAPLFGINSKILGDELRAQIEGVIPAKYRESGKEYNIRVRLKPEQRDLANNYEQIFVPNINGKLIKLSDVAKGKMAVTATSIDRLNNARTVTISSDVAEGIGIGEAMSIVDNIIKNEVNIPQDIKVIDSGGSEDFNEMMSSFVFAMFFGLICIYFVLASLYESFITPFTIMLAVPLAVSGALVALFVFKQPLDIFGILGIIMLVGVACKNSILLVDTANNLIKEGLSVCEALIRAGKLRFRPIMMTSIALIMGTVPLVIEFSHAVQSKASMGFVVLGGVVSSTLLTLVVIPAAYIYVLRLRLWSLT